MSDQITVVNESEPSIVVIVPPPAEVIVVQEADDVIAVTLTAENPIQVIIDDAIQAPEVIEVDIPGVPGPPGQDAGFEDLTAGATINGDRAVSLIGDLAYLTDPSNSNSARSCIGLSYGAVTIGNILRVVTAGTVQFSGWNWTPGLSVFVGPNGTLTQTRPTTGALVRFGVATKNTRIFINIQAPIFL